ncbi:MAG: methylmalonyl-CoA mutase family protein [Terricaulis sp.]
MADLQLGEQADEADWRALVEKGLKGASWDRLVGRTADGIELKPLYRESDFHTAEDVSGFPGAAPFMRGAAGWTIRQSFAHPDPEQTNHEILADLAGGVGGVELLLGEHGCAIESATDLDRALVSVILEAAPISLDGATRAQAQLLRDKLRGVAAPGTAFNLDPIGAMLRTGADPRIANAADFAAAIANELPHARALRVDARIVHEAGGSEAREISYALSLGIGYLRALDKQGVGIAAAAATIAFAVSIGADVLIETAKLRALRMCWARVLETSGAAAEHRSTHTHAFTSRRMMTRYDAETNIPRVTTAAFAAAIGGANEITTMPFTDALGLPTPFARRVARNTQLVLMEESRLGHVADPAGGAWFVEKLTRDLAERAWAKMQEIETQGGIVAALQSGLLQREVAEARATRQAAFARRKETITGVTDFPVLGREPPESLDRRRPRGHASALAGEGAGGPHFSPIRWAEPFEALRERAEGKCDGVFFATLGPRAEFTSRAQFAMNLLAVGGVASIGAETEHPACDAMIVAFTASDARVALVAGADTLYATEAEVAARALKAAGAIWVVLAGKPGEREAELRDAGIDQFIFTGVDVLQELETLHAALGVTS